MAGYEGTGARVDDERRSGHSGGAGSSGIDAGASGG
jgi:hypothetical protein